MRLSRTTGNSSWQLNLAADPLFPVLSTLSRLLCVAQIYFTMATILEVQLLLFGSRLNFHGLSDIDDQQVLTNFERALVCLPRPGNKVARSDVRRQNDM